MTAETAASEGQPLPLVNPIDPAFIENPYPTLDAVRAACPVLHEPLTNAWYLTAHNDVDPLLRSPEYVKEPQKAAPGTLTRLIFGETPREQLSMLLLDPPDHTRLRGLVSKAFTPRAIELLRPRARAIAEELLDAVEHEATFDVMDAFAAPLPTVVIAEMLGVDPRERRQFKAWSDALVTIFDPFAAADQRARQQDAEQNLRAYFERALAERRLAPRDDLMSRLIAAQEAGDRLSDSEMVVSCVLLLTAGNVTTTDLIGNGLLALLQHPEQLQRLREQPQRIPHAVEEMLRYDPPVVATSRITAHETQIDGCPIPAGQTVVASLAGANHDPAVYPDAGGFDIERADVHHHSFGGGPHFCLGAPLARMEAQVAFEALLRRFPRLSLAPDADPRRRRLPAFRGLTSLRVRVD